MANLSKKVMDIASGLVVRSIVSIIYELALASLIPLTIVLFSPGFIIDWNFASSVLAVLGLILVCFIILVWNKGKVHKAWVSLGLMTLLPGILALFFIYISPETLFNIVSRNFSTFAKIEPLLTEYIQHSLPKVTILMYAYVLIGCLLVWFGLHLKK